MLIPGDIVMYRGDPHVVSLATTDAVFFTNGRATRADDAAALEVLGHHDPAGWRAMLPGETVPTGTVCWSGDEKTYMTTDASCTRLDAYGNGQSMASVHGGFAGWDSAVFPPDTILPPPPFRPGDVVYREALHDYHEVRRMTRHDGVWYARTQHGSSIPVSVLALAPEGTVLCRHCNAAHLPDDDTEWEEDGTVCPSCFEEYTTCDWCGERHHTSQLVDVMTSDGTQTWCDPCVRSAASTCRFCSIIFDAAAGENGYCPDCADEDVECSECGRVERRADADDWEDGLCPDCVAVAESIHDWNYKPSPNFHGSAEGPFYGVELEIDGGGSRNTHAAGRIMGGDAFFYGKHDGSLDDGFEVVSHPATLDYHLHSAGWDGVMRRAVREDYRSHDAETCGLHVHISRTAFQDEHGNEDAALARLLLLFDMHWSKLLRFSRRTQDQCDRWAARYSMTRPHNDTEAVRAARDFKEENGSSRYYSVNLQNRNTVEIRMFRGSLNAETFYATIEMCDALRRIATETTTVELVGLTWSAMRSRWFDTYKYLPAYLSRRFKDEPQVEEEDEEMPDSRVLGDGDENPPPERRVEPARAWADAFTEPPVEQTAVAPDLPTGVIIGEDVWVPCGDTMPGRGVSVLVRDWDDMAQQYPMSPADGIHTSSGRFTPDMRHLCGQRFAVCQVCGNVHGDRVLTSHMLLRPAEWRRATEIPAVGSPVRFRQWDDMVRQYGMLHGGPNIACACGFTLGMSAFCGTTVQVPPHNRPDRFSYFGYSISPDMLEVPV